MLISPELLYRQGLLSKQDMQDRPACPQARVDYRLVESYKTSLLNIAFRRFRAMPQNPDYELFCSANKGWLDDFAAFVALRRHFHPRLWCDWPAEFRDRNQQALRSMKNQLKDVVDTEKFVQYQFFKQWSSLNDCCKQRGVRIIGDIPFYVAYDSADVWSHPEVFKLTNVKKPRFVGGVPPDYFSRTGQLWGNPIYNWQTLRKTAYRWWIQRIKHNLKLYDMVRLDHFRGFVAHWQVPAGCKTARHGKWAKGPGATFLKELFTQCSRKRVIAEDLGYITADVTAIMEKFQLPGMKVLQFAFDGDPSTNVHCPDNYPRNCVVHTGTHDNNTVRGWFDNEATFAQKKKLFAYIGRKIALGQVSSEFIRLAMSSPADLAIIPIQDILGLAEEARMNHPGRRQQNWTWRLKPGQIKASIAKKLANLTQSYARA